MGMQVWWFRATWLKQGPGPLLCAGARHLPRALGVGWWSPLHQGKSTNGCKSPETRCAARLALTPRATPSSRPCRQHKNQIKSNTELTNPVCFGLLTPGLQLPNEGGCVTCVVPQRWASEVPGCYQDWWGCHQTCVLTSP